MKLAATHPRPVARSPGPGGRVADAVLAVGGVVGLAGAHPDGAVVGVGRQGPDGQPCGSPPLTALQWRPWSLERHTPPLAAPA